MEMQGINYGVDNDCKNKQDRYTRIRELEYELNNRYVRFRELKPTAIAYNSALAKIEITQGRIQNLYFWYNY